VRSTAPARSASRILSGRIYRIASVPRYRDFFGHFPVSAFERLNRMVDIDLKHLAALEALSFLPL
jgi:hypothetical protein